MGCHFLSVALNQLVHDKANHRRAKFAPHKREDRRPPRPILLLALCLVSSKLLADDGHGAMGQWSLWLSLAGIWDAVLALVSFMSVNCFSRFRAALSRSFSRRAGVPL